MALAPLLALWLTAAPACGLPPPAAERPLVAGERLRYQVTWRGLPAGEVTLALGAGAGALRASIEARQTSLRAGRFHAESWLSLATLRPGRFQDLQEGWGERETTTADIARSPIAVRLDWRIGQRAGSNAYVRRPEVLDFASAIPYLRAAALEPGAAFCFDVVGAVRYWRLEGRVGGLEPVRTDAGRFQALRLIGTLRRADGQGEAIPIRLWIATGADRLPVAAEIDSEVGRLRAELATVARRS